MVAHYRSWDDVPAHLKTKTALGRLGLRPAPGQQPEAVKTSRHYKTPDYHLYDMAQAVPKRQMTPEQEAALATAQAASEAARTCRGCGYLQPLNPGRYGRVRGGYCSRCRQLREIERAREDAAAWARQLLDDGNFIIMDTETTDLDGEIVELSLIDANGRILFNRRFNPLSLVAPGAAAVHGLTNEVLACERPFPELYDELATILAGAAVVVIYNADFDNGRMVHTCELHDLPAVEYRYTCAMEEYAAFIGEPRRGEGFRWQPLPGGDHSALGDCLASLRVLREMAQAQIKETAVFQVD